MIQNILLQSNRFYSVTSKKTEIKICINRQNSQYRRGLTGLKRTGFKFVIYIYKCSWFGLMLLLYTLETILDRLLYFSTQKQISTEKITDAQGCAECILFSSTTTGIFKQFE